MATAQSQMIADTLRARTGRAVELAFWTTHGDVSRAHLAQIGGTGVFVSALREHLLAGRVDLAVHSLKDLPTTPVDGVALAAVPRRDDPRDALIARAGAKLADLPPGARIGTGSPRRVAELRLLRPDLEYVPIRGNADTRIGKVAAGEVAGVVLAYAGLCRIGRQDDATEVFDADQVLPAPGQGALAVECRADAGELVGLLATIDDPRSRAEVTAERELLARLEAGCSAPVGAHAVGADTGELVLTAVVVGGDGRQVRLSARGPLDQAAELGRSLATEMLDRGAAEMIGGQHVERS